MHRSLFALLSSAGLLVLVPLFTLGCAGTAPGADRPAGLNFYVQAVEAYNKGDNDRAVILLLEAVRQNPDLRMARSMLGDLYRGRGDLKSALPNYERLAKLDPYSSNNQYRLGLAYQLLNRLKEAAAAYLKALQLDPKDWRSNMNLGLVYLALDQLDEAVTYLERASKYSPDNPEIWANLGVALDARGSMVLAEAAYKKSLELDGKQDTTLLNLASNLVAQDKGPDALTVMEQAIKNIQTAPARKRYADALALCQKNADAEKQYDMAIKADAFFWPAYTEKGFLMLKLYRDGMQLDDGRRKAAIDLLNKSLALNTNQPRVLTAIKQWSGQSLFGK